MQTVKRIESEIEYFNRIFYKTKNYANFANAEQIPDISIRGVNSHLFNPNLICSSDSLKRKFLTPPSLLNLLLIYLHKAMAFKIFIRASNNCYSDYRQSLQMITSLMIPQTLIDKLTELFVTCPRHVYLRIIHPRTNMYTYYVLHPKKRLYFLLQTLKEWDCKLNEYGFPLTELVNLTLQLMVNTKFQIFFYDEYVTFIKTNCLEFSIEQTV